MWGQGLVIFSFVVRLTCFIELVYHCHTCTSEPCENLSANVREADTSQSSPGDWRCLSRGPTAQSYFQPFLKLRHLRICWGSMRRGAEWISTKEVILKLGISENGQINGAGCIWSTRAHKYTATPKADCMYTHWEKRETLKLAVHKLDLSKCVNTVQKHRKHGLNAQFHMTANHLKLFYCFHIADRKKANMVPQSSLVLVLNCTLDLISIYFKCV